MRITRPEITTEQNRKNLRGGEHHFQKITPDDVRAIRRRLRAGELQVDIAPAYGLTKGAISQIATGRTWAWVLDDPEPEVPTPAPSPPPPPPPLPMNSHTRELRDFYND